MDNNLQNLINVAFKDIESICRLKIDKYFDGLNYQEKRDYDIVAFQPAVPNSTAEIEEHISAHIDIYADETAENAEDLKAELIEYCERIGLSVDPILPLQDFKVAMRSALHQLSHQELLNVGIFGYPVSEEEAIKNKEKLISWFLISIRQAAFEQLMHDRGKFNPENSTWNHQEISSKFPDLVRLVKEHFERRNHLN